MPSSNHIPIALHEAKDLYAECDYLQVGSQYFVNTGHSAGRKVTQNRVESYLAALQGRANVKTGNRLISVETYHASFMSLHQVQWSTNLVTPGNPEGQWQCDCKGFWHSLCCAHVYFVRHVRGELDLDKVRVVLCPLQTLVWYGRAKAWVTNQGSVPIRRPVQDMYGCFALSNSRAKLLFFLRGWGKPCSKVVRSVPWVTTWVCRLGNRYARICPRGRRLGGNATLDRRGRGNQRHPRRRRRRRRRRRGRSATWVE